MTIIVSGATRLASALPLSSWRLGAKAVSIVSTVALLTLAPSASPARASGSQMDLQRYCNAKFPNSIQQTRQTQYGRQLFCRRPSPTQGFSLQPVAVSEVCQFQTGGPGFHTHGSIVHCDGQTERGPNLRGTWRIKPLYIVNRRECGAVKYTGRIVVTRLVRPSVYAGMNYFRWDPSRINPACTFRKSGPGQVEVELTVRGNRVTIRYKNTGRYNFANDNLILRGTFMEGRDAAGQHILYQKIS